MSQQRFIFRTTCYKEGRRRVIALRALWVYFFLEDLESDESWRRIEREFWQEVGTMVMRAEEASNPPDFKKR